MFSKKFLALFMMVALLISSAGISMAQDDPATAETAEQVQEAPAEEPAAEPATETVDNSAASSDDNSSNAMSVLKQNFLDGGWEFMGIVLVCLVIGLAFCIERIIYISMADINAKKFMVKLNDTLSSKDLEGAKELCKSTRGPISSIVFQGLNRTDEGIDVVEKSLVSYGSVQMGLLERGMIWIALFISLAPMLGFMGTVIGMIGAFGNIETAGAISASIVASGIKVALLTTVFGLIVAVILQIFYNYIVSKMDGIVNKMEDASISFVDMLIKHDIVKRD